jgi:hypothetical protein
MHSHPALITTVVIAAAIEKREVSKHMPFPLTTITHIKKSWIQMQPLVVQVLMHPSPQPPSRIPPRVVILIVSNYSCHVQYITRLLLPPTVLISAAWPAALMMTTTMPTTTPIIISCSSTWSHPITAHIRRNYMSIDYVA